MMIDVITEANSSENIILFPVLIFPP